MAVGRGPSHRAVAYLDRGVQVLDWRNAAAERSHHQLSAISFLWHSAVVAFSGNGDALGRIAGGTVQPDHPYGIPVRGGGGIDLSLVHVPPPDRSRTCDHDRRGV